MGKVATGGMITNRIAASSLVEVVVAMVILMLSFGLAILLFVKVAKSNRNLQQVKNEALVTAYVAETKRTRAFINRTEEVDGKLLSMTIKPYNGNHSLLYLSVALKDQKDSLLAEHQELIYYSRHSPTAQ